MSTGHVDEIWIASEPRMTRVQFLKAGTVVEIWHEFNAAPDRIGEVHQLKIDQIFGGQNRATARLDDGTPVSLRLKQRDRVQSGERVTATITAAPRQNKPWQAVVGARLSSAHVILLPDGDGLQISRLVPDDLAMMMNGHLSAKLPAGFGAILRGAAVEQEIAIVEEELAMLVQLWRDGVQSSGCIHNGGTLAQKAVLYEPRASVYMEGDELPTDTFEAAYDEALDSVSGTSVDLSSGGKLWFEPTQALVAVDVDSSTGGFDALINEAPSMIAYQLRLRALSGLIAIDVPRLSPGAARAFTKALKDSFATDPRQPKILGRTRGGIMECRIPHGRPSLDIGIHVSRL